MSETSPPPEFRLDAFLKYVGAVGTGGEAKVRIQEGEVSLNGQPETRRRKQLVVGDVVEIAGETHVVPAKLDESGLDEPSLDQSELGESELGE